MPFALLPSLLSLIIIHLPPATLSCDVLSLSVSLPPISLSLSLTYSTSFSSSSHIQHTAFALSLSLLLPRFPSAYFIPIPRLSLSVSIYIYISLFRSNAYVLLPWERTSAPRGKEGELGSWVGSGVAKGKKERKERESNGALTVWDC